MKQININNIIWTVYLVKNDDSRLILDEKHHLGLTDFAKYEIYISENENPQLIQYTILHELIHAILCSNGFMLKDEFNQEEVAEFIAYNTTNIIKLTNEIFTIVRPEKNT